jgi:uncharacterized protein (TIGR02147 family)
MALSKTKLREIVRSLNVTDHSDYCDFLALVFAAAKAEDPSYSYVRYSEDLGVGSANAQSIIVGRRKLTLKAAERLCEALTMTGVQKRYFLNLVEQKRAKSTTERDSIFDERLELKQRLLPTELDRKQLAFFEHWYHAAILEILRLEEARDDAAWLSHELSPTVPESKVEESLKLLTELGYLRRDDQRQRLYPTDVTITTGNEVIGLALVSYHRQMLKLAMDAIEGVAAEERDISALTLMATPELVAQFKDEVAGLRKRFLALAAAETHATEVVQLNMQLFPLKKKTKGDTP